MRFGQVEARRAPSSSSVCSTSGRDGLIASNADLCNRMSLALLFFIQITIFYFRSSKLAAPITGT